MHTDFHGDVGNYVPPDSIRKHSFGAEEAAISTAASCHLLSVFDNFSAKLDVAGCQLVIKLTLSIK